MLKDERTAVSPGTARTVGACDFIAIRYQSSHQVSVNSSGISQLGMVLEPLEAASRVSRDAGTACAIWRCDFVASLISNTLLPGPYRKTIPMALWWSERGGAVSYEQVTPVSVNSS
jgi:hypothetical protein